MVGIIIVTYGNRWNLLKKLIVRLINQQFLSAILIVNNNVKYNLEKELSEFQCNYIRIYSFRENRGSAEAYKKGIEIICSLEKIDYIWLLDDDNLPTQNSLSYLIDYWKGNKINPENDALMCLRNDRPYLVQVAHGKPVRYYFPKKNAFLGLHIFRIHEFFIKKLLSGYKSKNTKPVIIPCAPYGGLFFHKDIIKKIGYPDERFFVYADDFEFTYRITNAGGKITLVPDATIDDLEKTWFNKTKHGIFYSRYLEQNDFRSYMSVRNTVYLQNKYLVKNKLLYRINFFFFMLHIFTLALLKNKLTEYRNFRLAVEDGNNENFDNTSFYNK